MKTFTNMMMTTMVSSLLLKLRMGYLRCYLQPVNNDTMKLRQRYLVCYPYRESRLYNISGDCTVFVGRHYLPTRQLSTLEATQQTFRIVHYVIHENYNDTDLPLGYDLALVKLSRVIKFTKEVLPICLPFNQPELTEASVCYSGGWGYTETRKLSCDTDRLLI